MPVVSRGGPARLRMKTSRSGSSTRAAASSGTSRLGTTEVKVEPGPSRTRSAARTAWRGGGGAGGEAREAGGPPGRGGRLQPDGFDPAAGRHDRHLALNGLAVDPAA